MSKIRSKLNELESNYTFSIQKLNNNQTANEIKIVILNICNVLNEAENYIKLDENLVCINLIDLLIEICVICQDFKTAIKYIEKHQINAYL